MKNFTKVTILLILLSCSFSLAQKKHSVIGKNITQLNITYDNTVTPAPGYHIPLGITAVSDKNKGFTTKGMLEGKTSWKDFNIVVDGGIVEKGHIIIFNDPRQIKHHTVNVTASPIDNDNVKQSIAIKVSYDVDVVADFSGNNGREGRNGRNGRAGSDGNDSSSGNGGNGSKAQNGEHGTDGGNGKNGFNIAVYATVINDPEYTDPLLKVRIKNLENGLSYYYLMNVTNNNFRISTDGGNGGNGGRGGHGGRGGNGGHGAFYSNTGSVPGRGGNGSNGGDAGNGGSGGEGGNAGNITVELDPSVKKFSKAIGFSFKAGSAGDEGKSGEAGTNGKAGNGGLGSGTFGVKGMIGIDGVEGSIGEEAPEPMIKFGVIDFDW